MTGIASRRKYIPSRARDFRLPARQPLHEPSAPRQEAFYFGLDVVVRLGWTGRGGMFLAPTGNPSSLRVGHPDVATEHTGLSPASLPLSGQVE